MWDLPPPDPGFEIVVASRGMSKGVAQTDGVQFVPRGFVQIGKLQVGAQWKNVSSDVAEGEAAAFVNYAPTIGRFQVTVGAAYKFQTGTRGSADDDSFEFTASAARKLGKLGLKLWANYSPDNLGSARRSLYLEGGPTFEIDGSTRLSANVGRRSRVNGVDYTSWNAGISRSLLKNVTMDARYYGNSKGELGETYGDRVVISGRVAF